MLKHFRSLLGRIVKEGSCRRMGASHVGPHSVRLICLTEGLGANHPQRYHYDVLDLGQGNIFFPVIPWQC